MCTDYALYSEKYNPSNKQKCQNFILCKLSDNHVELAIYFLLKHFFTKRVPTYHLIRLNSRKKLMQNTQTFQQFSPCLSAQRIDFEMTRLVLTKWTEGKPEQKTKLLQNT